MSNEDHPHSEPYCHVCSFRTWLKQMVSAVRNNDHDEIRRLQGTRPEKTFLQGSLRG